MIIQKDDSWLMLNTDGKSIVLRHENQTLTVEPWNRNSVRVRCALNGVCSENVYDALLPSNNSEDIHLELTEENASLTNGKIKVEICLAKERFWYLPKAYSLTFYNTDTGEELFREAYAPIHPMSRSMRYNDDKSMNIEYLLRSYENEKFYGMGQHAHGRLNLKGCLLELKQVNSEVNIPFTISSRGYGFLWNNPSVGQVFFGANNTKWTADSTNCLDYWVTAGDTPKEIMSSYMTATGKPPMLPDWAAGFWQCKLRYQTQDEIMSIAMEYKKRNLPISVIVIDYFHWKAAGDWSFDPEYFPDPDGMVKELGAMGIKLMVSVWPTVESTSVNYAQMRQKGYLVLDRFGEPLRMTVDSPSVYYDPTNPDASAYHWEKIRENYCKYGIKVFWLDAIEPEYFPDDESNRWFAMGNGIQVSNLYPIMQQKAYYEGLKKEGETEIITLGRSAYTGSQKYGAAVWSGDIPSTFESLQNQVRAGLNMAVSGIAWWTTDIGGFVGGNIESDYFRELVVRWFQYGVFCPLLRLHGARESNTEKSMQPNEAWSFGDEAYKIIREILFLRERLRPYIMKHMKSASEDGIPIMRPMFFEYPDDPRAYEIEDQFFFGEDILVAPILSQSTWSREVYLPKGGWVHAFTREEYQGEMLHENIRAVLNEIPVFVRKGSNALPIFKENGHE